MPGLFTTQARPGTGSAIFQPRRRRRTRAAVPAGTIPLKNVDAATRNPLFLLRLFGLLLLRYAQRTFLSLLLNVPPRSTRRRFEPVPTT